MKIIEEGVAQRETREPTSYFRFVRKGLFRKILQQRWVVRSEVNFGDKWSGQGVHEEWLDVPVETKPVSVI
jgi:hypothetical protein